MAKGVRVNKVSLGRRIQKQKRQKAKHKKKNIATQKEMLKKATLSEELPQKFTSTRQKKMARKMMQRRERAKSQMDVEATKSTNKKEKSENKEKNEDDDENMMEE
ncbi:uncharacterized protein [Clytia hemisphaerica]|uniref:Uncharacterized protein n=1 Tax=Clytia hemisphaerica TaxID=252671 RepID=A0A7M5USW6_9CNID